MKRDGLDRAIADFSTAIKLNPQNAHAYGNRALGVRQGPRHRGFLEGAGAQSGVGVDAAGTALARRQAVVQNGESPLSAGLRHPV
jgi:hypothetical protein